MTITGECATALLSDSVFVVVTGMHRSGTSAVAELLSSTGCELGPEHQLMGATDANPRGHFESIPIVAMNDRILGEVGAHWLHPQADARRVRSLASSSLAAEAHRVLGAAGYRPRAAEPFLAKDPRFCLTFPFWQGLLADFDEVVVVLVYRHPDEVVASLERRDGVTTGYGHYLWNAYNRSILTATAGTAVVAVSYDDLLADPLSAAARIGRSFASEEADRFTVDRRLQRHRALRGEPPNSELWRALEAVARGERPTTLPDSVTPPKGADALSALGRLAMETHDLRRDRDFERARRKPEWIDARLRVLSAEHARATARLGDYEYSRAAGLARASWALKRRLRRSLGRREPSSVPASSRPTQEGEPVVAPTADEPEFSIVVVANGPLPSTAGCLRSIVSASGPESYELIVVVVDDRQDAGEMRRWLSRCTGIRVVALGENPDDLHATNVGAATATGDHFVFVDDETVVHAGWLGALRTAFDSSDDVGAVGAKIAFADGSLKEAGGVVFADGCVVNYGRNGDPDDPRFNVRRAVDFCSAHCLAVRRSCWNEIGGLDERFGPASYQGPDLAFSLRQRGYRVLYEPGVVVTHLEDVWHTPDVAARQKRNRDVFGQKWATDLARQPSSEVALDVAAWRTTGPHVLVIDHEVPAADQDAGSLRMTTVLELLVELGCRITFVPQNGLRREPYVRTLQDAGVTVLYNRKRATLSLDQVAPDVQLVIASRPNVAAAFVDEIRLRFPVAGFVYDMVDFHALREERSATAGSATAADEIRAVERQLAQTADLVLAISDDEAELVRQLEPEARIAVLPNIHRPNRPPRGFSERSGVLFVGSWRHLPNQDAIEWLATEIAPRIAAADPSIMIHIVGSDIPDDGPWTSVDNITCHGWVPSLDEIASSVRINAVPLRYGAGLKGKVGDALARGIPTVTTPIGAEGFGAVADVLVIELEADRFADAVVALHSDEDRWNQLADLGARLVDKHFGLERARQGLSAMLDAFVGCSG